MSDAERRFVTHAVGEVQSVGHHVRSALGEEFHRLVVAEHRGQVETGARLLIAHLQQVMLLNGFEAQILHALRGQREKLDEIRLVASRSTVEEIRRQLGNVDLLDQSRPILSTFLAKSKERCTAGDGEPRLTFFVSFAVG